MIISPPFLPDSTGLSEDAWLDAAMAQPEFLLTGTNSPEGSFPLSLGLAWHNGLHIQAPQPGGVWLPVRAIADGVVVFVNPPTPPNKDLTHGLNYNPFGHGAPTAAWSSDGLVIIRHKTEIGADGTTPTEITYFSAYMHLGSLARCPKTKAPWKAGDAIYRKDQLGTPGQIYGHNGKIHFEICCDDANLRQLLKRAPDWTHQLTPSVPTANGRTDSVFGSTYIYLPAGTPTSASEPAHHLRANAAQSLSEPQWVQITYDKGASILTSYNTLGGRIGTPRVKQDEEYELHTTAKARHQKSQDNTGRAPSSPSGWYELLRFGRKLGPDPLPDNAAHWREIPTATGTVWADLNAAGTFKFSDADFPTFLGWNCFNDDTSPNDQRCDSPNMKMLIRDPDKANSKRMEKEQLLKRLGLPEVRARLRRTICQFPCEWVRDTMVERYSWLKDEQFPPTPEAPGTQRWDRFVKHIQAITFPRADLPADFLNANWRFHPREFVGVMRRCGWLSKSELVQLVPRHAIRTGTWKDAQGQKHKGTFWEPVPLFDANLAVGVVAYHRIPLNRTMRKYGISTPMRQVSFLSNALQETKWLASLEEGGGDGYWYTPWHGRGFLQVTHPDNYFNYWEWRGRSVPEPVKKSLVQASKTESAKKSNRSMTAMGDVNFPELTQEIKDWRKNVQGHAAQENPATGDKFAPSDSAGHYATVNKMLRYADEFHELQRHVVPTIDMQGQNLGAHIYYRSLAFWKVSASVNLPSVISSTDYEKMNGFDSRCSAYGVALAVLTERRLPNAQGNMTIEYPEGYEPRRK